MNLSCRRCKKPGAVGAGIQIDETWMLCGKCRAWASAHVAEIKKAREELREEQTKATGTQADAEEKLTGAPS